ncbi:MAG: hypothetical protein V8T87_04890 [Victivallales bacterium]
MCAEALLKITPYHPKHIVAAPRGSVEDHLPYAAAADFYGIDIYPVPAGSHSNLEDRTLTPSANMPDAQMPCRSTGNRFS